MDEIVSVLHLFWYNQVIVGLIELSSSWNFKIVVRSFKVKKWQICSILYFLSRADKLKGLNWSIKAHAQMLILS